MGTFPGAVDAVRRDLGLFFTGSWKLPQLAFPCGQGAHSLEDSTVHLWQLELLDMVLIF